MSNGKLTLVGDADKRPARIHDLVKAQQTLHGLKRGSTLGTQETLQQYTTLHKRLLTVRQRPLLQSFYALRVVTGGGQAGAHFVDILTTLEMM